MVFNGVRAAVGACRADRRALLIGVRQARANQQL